MNVSEDDLDKEMMRLRESAKSDPIDLMIFLSVQSLSPEERRESLEQSLKMHKSVSELNRLIEETRLFAPEQIDEDTPEDSDEDDDELDQEMGEES